GAEGQPISVHSGTCQDFSGDPTLELGNFEQTNAYAEGEQEPGDMDGDVPDEAEALGPVYKIDDDDVDYEDTELTGEEARVVAVHQSADDYDTIVACGQLLEVRDGD